jgi:hypothetical protein
MNLLNQPGNFYLNPYPSSYPLQHPNLSLSLYQRQVLLPTQPLVPQSLFYMQALQQNQFNLLLNQLQSAKPQVSQIFSQEPEKTSTPSQESAPIQKSEITKTPKKTVLLSSRGKKIHEKYSEEDDRLILKYYKKFGADFIKIAKHVTTKELTANMVRMRYYRLKRRFTMAGQAPVEDDE